MPHKGVCVGGPMAGLTISTRSDDGFVAVDKPASACWLYVVNTSNGRFTVCTDDDPTLLDKTDGCRALDLDRIGGAIAQGLDIIAVPGEPDQPDEYEPAEADLLPDPPPLTDVAVDPREGED